MIRLAILADIHGNYQALEAVLDDISNNFIDKVIIAGDHICDGPEPDKILDTIRKIPNSYIIKGNREDYIISLSNGLNSHWFDFKQFSSVIWTFHNISDYNKNYIQNLKPELNIYSENKTIRIVHGAPNDDYGIIKSEKDLEHAMIKIKEDILVYGHTHNSYNQIKNNRLGINPGSVGLPLYKNAFAEYAIVEVANNSFSVQHKEISYDKTKYIMEMKKCGLLEIAPIWSRTIIESIITGENVSLDFVTNAYRILHSISNDTEIIPNDLWDDLGKKWNWKFEMFG